MDPIIVLVVLVVLITIGFPIFLALGLSGLVGLWLIRQAHLAARREATERSPSGSGTV